MSASRDDPSPLGEGDRNHQALGIQGKSADANATNIAMNGAQAHGPGATAGEIQARIAGSAGSDTQAKKAQAAPQPRPFKQVEPGSLYDILHDNAGETLYVLPMMWTDRHAQLLGVRFVENPPILTPVPPAKGPWVEPSKTARTLTKELHVLSKIDKKQTPSARLLRKTHAMKHMMSLFFPALSRPKSNADLDLYFGTKVYRNAVRVHCLWKTTYGVNGHYDAGLTDPPCSPLRMDKTVDYSPDQPLLAYLCRSQMKTVRDHLFKIARAPGGGVNEPVKRLLRLRSKMLMPANIDHDVYIASILIAMAQNHFYRPTSIPSKPGSTWGVKAKKGTIIGTPKFRDIKVQLITHEEGNPSWPNFVVYTAVISAAFLDRFRHPEKAFTSSGDEEVDVGLEITHTNVPFFPLLGLRERLSRALGREIGGEPWFEENTEFISFWSELVEKPKCNRLDLVECGPPSDDEPIPRRKRKARAPLSDVLNSSFEEDYATNYPSSSDDDPVLSPSAKRRRTTDSPSTLRVC